MEQWGWEGVGIYLCWESRREGRGVAEERDGGMVPEHRGRGEECGIGKKTGGGTGWRRHRLGRSALGVTHPGHHV